MVKKPWNDHLNPSLDLNPSKILWSELKRIKFERKFKSLKWRSGPKFVYKYLLPFYALQEEIWCCYSLQRSHYNVLIMKVPENTAISIYSLGISLCMCCHFLYSFCIIKGFFQFTERDFIICVTFYVISRWPPAGVWTELDVL